MKHEGFKGITLQQMEALIHLVEERNFSRAARKMLLTQPALTKHIKNAEDALGTKIVNRGGPGLSLTPEGTILYRYARRILRLRDEVNERIARARDDDSGIVSVGASTIPVTYILPRILSGFKRKHAGIQVHVQAADSDETLDMILNGEAELGLIGKRPIHPKIHGEALWADKLILAVPAGHPWAEKVSVTPEELVGQPFIVREKGSGTRDIMETCLKNQGRLNLADLNVAAELGSSEAVKEGIIAGLGLSIISIHAVARELRQGLLRGVSLRGCSIERSFYLIYRKQFDLMRHHQLFVDYVKQFKLGDGASARKG